MKIAIVYESMTGNTKALAQAIEEALEGENLVYVGGPDQVPEADLYLVGSWTDKGMCHQGIGEFLQSLKEKKIAYFGTAGFGGSQEYYEMLFQRVAQVVDGSNQLLGSFYCQGKMPAMVRQRYEKQLQEHPGDPQLQASLENFDRALSHPDGEDLDRAKTWAKAMVSLAK
ncbi:MAG: flavodoxin family protein BilS [Acutalibacter sp.]|jgi:flavodoxin I